MSARKPKRRFVTTQVEVEGRVETKIVEMPEHEATAWGADASLRIVGQPVRRVDALDKVTGRAIYTADIHRPGMLFAALVRAPIAAGTITDIDLEGAWAVPGVVDVLVAKDVPGRIKAGGVPLLSRKVQYPQQPVAAICAESREAAERAAAATRLTWEAAPFAVTFEDATRADAPAVRGPKKDAVTKDAAVADKRVTAQPPVAPDNRAAASAHPGPSVVYAQATSSEENPGPSVVNLLATSPEELSRGDIVAGFAAAEVIIEREFRTPSALHTAMEPHGAVAEWDGDRLTIWESTQAIFRVRDQVARALGLPASGVRVIKDFMGGGFGAKSGPGTHTYVAALLARRTGRAVRCVVDREGEQTDTGHRASTRQVVRLGAKRDGTLTAVQATVEIPLGISGWEASPAAVYHQMYGCPNVHTRETNVYVNTQGMESFRAPGHVEGAFALERAMDILARELDIDPLDLRLRNFAETDLEKDRPYSANQLRRCYEEGAARFGWREARGAGRDAGREARGAGREVRGARREA
jgi:xanthine dehydrogenase YagR molybdenum-binding subunit